MYFAGERYYKLNLILLTALGLWPYNNTVFKPIQRIFFTLLFAFSLFLQLGKIATVISDLEFVLQILSFTVPCLVFCLKYATFWINSKDIKKLIEGVKYDWNMIKYKEEIEIFQQYASLGNLVNISITILFYLFLFMFLTTQILPKVLDVVVPLNESRPCKLLAIATFFFDQEEHFALIFLHMTVALFTEITTILATESTSLACLQHCCALFKITSFRIERVFNCELHVSGMEKNMIYYTNIIDAIIIHKRAIEYFDYLWSSFQVSYFILLVLGVCSLSINMLRLFRAAIMKETEEMFAIGLLIISHFIYMFINNFVAQSIINHSIDVFYKTCDLPWYSLPVQLQKLLQFIMRRSMTACKFTFCNVFDASNELFASLVSASLSYFTVFWSIQH